MTFEFVSPVDHRPLRHVEDSLVSIDVDEHFPVVDGIPHLIAPGRRAAIDRFSQDYAAVRAAEGRRGETAEYYRALPYQDLSGRFPEQWARRAATFDLLVAELGSAPLTIVDAGAGNGWMASRLTKLGHEVLALDVNVDADDGLAARVHHECEFEVVRAEISATPLRDATVDVVVLNAAAHYVDLRDVVAEARRIVRADGRLVIADSPVYRDPMAGRAMVEEMAANIRSLGVEPAEPDGPGFLTEDDLRRAGLPWRHLGVESGGALRSLRRKLAQMRAGRELAEMPLLVATIDESTAREVA